MNAKRPFPRYNGVCRLCGRSQPATRKEFFSAGGLRCLACGGICDPDKPLFKQKSPKSHIVAGRSSTCPGT